MKETFNIPKDIKLEKRILSAMIVDETAHLDAMPILKLPEMFYEPAHQLIYKAILELSYDTRPVDLVTINQQLAASGTLERAGGTYALAELSSSASSAAHIEEWCRILVQFWLRRELIKNADRIKSMACRDDQDSLQVLEASAAFNDQLNEILYSGNGHRKSWAENLDAVVDRVRLLSNQKEHELSGVPTGLKKADKFTGGWQNSDLIIMAARPGMGKTSMVLKNFVECGLQGVPAGFFSLEMAGHQLGARSVSINSNFHLTQLVRDGFSKAEYFVTLVDKTDDMKKFPVYIDDTPGLDIRDLIARARIWKRKHGIRILFIDYLQLITDRTKESKGNREQEISSISRKLKGLAKELDIPVIALSQLSRAVETRGGSKRPLLSDLRESGAIEQDADIVTFLYRPEYYKIELDHEEMEEFCNAEFIFAKYRGGSLGTIDVYFQGDKAKYSDYDEQAKYKAENSFQDVPFSNNEVPNGSSDLAF